MNRLVPIFFLFGLFFGSAAIAQPRCWEGEITIPTYPWEADINPKFQELEGKIYYPYPLLDVLSSTKEDRTYKALYLENEYLKVTCLPELGGRIHSVLDKTTGREMFHKNNVIKPGLIGLRGAWVSGGIEWNTGPQGHTVTAVSPVDAMVMENEDGSVTLVVGNTEQIFRTHWTVKVKLRPGRSFLEEDIRIFNPTDGVHPYYFWNCTAFPCLPGTRFIFPMSLGCDHNGEKFFNWPIHEGKDLTWLKNYDEASSIFAYECDQDFFGAYDVDLDQGIVAYADHHVLPGKKAWTWGQSEDGLVSQQAITDDDGPYIEVQSGPLRTQADYGLLYPREEVHWQEWWYPVHGLGEGFEFANKDVAVQAVRTTSVLTLKILATGDFPQCKVTLAPPIKVSRKQSGERDLLLERICDLNPDGSIDIQVGAESLDPIVVSIESSNGTILGSFETPLEIPIVTPPHPKWSQKKKEEDMTVEELYLKGLEEDKRTNRQGAEEWYHKALSRDASHVAALRSLAVLDLESGLYESATDKLVEALERNPDDAWSWYFRGVAAFRLENSGEALVCGHRAAKLLPNSSVGSDLVGRAQAWLANREASTRAFQDAVERNPRDTRAMESLSIALTVNKEYEEAILVAESVLTEDPMSISSKMVISLLAREDPWVNRPWGQFEEQLWDLGEKEFSVLETFLTLSDLRFPLASGSLLSAVFETDPGMLSGPPHDSPLAAYYDRYYYWPVQRSSSRRPDPELKTFRSDFVFPSRPATIGPLKRAQQLDPGDALSPLHLGNLLAGLNRADEAVPHWEKAAELNPKLSVPLRNLGLYAWKKEKDFAKAEDYYHRAIQARPSDDTLYRDLARILVEDGKRSEAIATLESYPLEKVRSTDYIEDLSKDYADAERYDDALAVLEGARFSNWEGRTACHTTFVKAHLERGKKRFEEKDYPGALEDFRASLTYPEQLGVGRPAKVAEAERLYWVGEALSQLGNDSEALATWKRGAGGSDDSETEKEYREKCKEAIEAAGR